MRVELPRRPRGPVLILFLIAVMMSSCARGKAFAETGDRAVRSALIVFAEHTMRDDEWSALFDALERGVRSEAAHEPGLRDGAEFLRGDGLPPGIRVSEPITVYLHRNCSLVAMAQNTSSQPLGWVWRVHGRIEPFIHVDCAQIALELGPVVLGMDRKRRDTVMAEAIARVILHEWVHVETQSARHARDGVAKASFGILDLLAYDEQVRQDPRILKRAWIRD